MTLYHGSNAELDELTGDEPGYEGSLGWGLYLTTDPDFARIFGKRIYEVESPVPDELVAYIEPNSYDCGTSLTMYTPGSVPFTFEIVDRNTGETHRYSVLGACDEEVRESLRRSVLEDFAVSDDLKDDVRSEVPKELSSRFSAAAAAILEAASESQDVDEQIELFLEIMAEQDGADDATLDGTIKPLLEALAREVDEFADSKVEERLGDEIDLDDISATVEKHGYSAFFIEGYAPGNEYVIVDPDYLPIPVG